MTKQDVQGIAEGAAVYQPSPPMPLVTPNQVGQAYPVDALGPVLGPAARAIGEKVQAPLALCAHSVLGAVSLAAQKAINVALPQGDSCPASLFLLSIAESGERKSSCDQTALAPIRTYEAALLEAYDSDMHSFLTEKDAFEHANKGVLKAQGKSTDTGAIKEALAKLGPKPTQPLAPMIICSDPTIEGLLKSLADGQPNMGLMTDEAGVFVGGHAMNKDNRLKTMSNLTGLWGGAPISRSRSMEGTMMMIGRRVTTHLMGQPIVIQELLGDPVAREQGFLPRFLTVAPPSLAGTRMFRPVGADAMTALRTYELRMGELLAAAPSNNLDRQAVTLSTEALHIWVQFHDQVEAALGPEGAYNDFRAIAGRMPEQVCRLAAILAFAADPNLETIGGEAMQNAIMLGQFYLAEAVRLAGLATISLEMQNAEKLRLWMVASAKHQITRNDLLQRSPNRFRSKGVIDRLIPIIEDHGWISQIPAGAADFDGNHCRIAWAINRAGTC